MRTKIAVAMLALGAIWLMLTDHQKVQAQSPIKVQWSVSADRTSRRWVATATTGTSVDPFPPHTELELEWPEDFPAPDFCMDTFYMSSVFPQSSPVSYAIIDHAEVRGGGSPLIARRICHQGTKPEIYIESQGDSSFVFHLTLAGDMLGPESATPKRNQ